MAPRLANCQQSRGIGQPCDGSGDGKCSGLNLDWPTWHWLQGWPIANAAWTLANLTLGVALANAPVESWVSPFGVGPEVDQPPTGPGLTCVWTVANEEVGG
eukprot:366229-Chlamydomonas_euryale.AAC.41